jgi:hypothetical protein
VDFDSIIVKEIPRVAGSFVMLIATMDIEDAST